MSQISLRERTIDRLKQLRSDLRSLSSDKVGLDSALLL